MSTRSLGWCVTCLALCAGCSSDSGPGTAPSESSGGKAGATSTGGASGAGGATSTGGATGTGGYDPALAAQCSIDSTGNNCRICLAATCCDAVEPCFADSECMTEFSTYQSCIRQPNQLDPAGCLSTFTRYAKGDAGNEHQLLVGCIITTCQVCGGVEAF